MRKITLFLMSLFLTVGAMAQDYSVPGGNTYQYNYLTSITTQGATENISYSVSSHPSAIHVTVPGKIKVQAGHSFTIKFVAYSLGNYSTSTVREDIRYCHASLFTDFDGDCDFGNFVERWGNKPPVHNVGGNYNECMDITATIEVPTNAKVGTSRIRMIYTNAWTDWPTANATNLDKGIAYDIEVEVTEPENPIIRFNYKFTYNDEVKDEYTYETGAEEGAEYPNIEKTFPYGITAIKPEGVVTADLAGKEVTIELRENLPFVAAKNYASITNWYYMTIHGTEPKYLFHEAGQTHIPLTVATKPEAEAKFAWAFVGNPFDGFQIFNNAAGEGMILSSSTTISGDGANTHPVMTESPVATGNNTLWVATESSHGINGFFLAQKDYANNRMNNRDSKLAYWTGGADDGSTFMVESYEYIEVDKTGLQALIEEAEELLSMVSESQKTQGDAIDLVNKISSNAAQNPGDGNTGGSNDGAGIAGLTDTDPSTYFHSRWSGTAVNEDHYLQIDLGENNSLKDFAFAYQTRKTDDANSTSPAPLAIEVRVSKDGSNFGNPIAIFTKDEDGLPTHADLGQTLWNSGVLSATENIRYIRLTVTDSRGPGENTWNNHHFFAMGTLNLYSIKEGKVLNDAYKEYISSDLFEAYSNALNVAKAVNEDVAALPADVNNATDALTEQLNNINAAIESVRSHTLTVTNAGYATLFLDFSATIPTFTGEDAGAYIVTGVKAGNWLNLVKVEGVLPANTGIIIKADAGDYEFVASSGTPVNVDENLLKGTLTDTYIEGEAYVLGYAKGTEEVVFAKAEMNGTSWLNKANKAYLPISALPSASNISFYGLRYDDEDDENTTAIENVEIVNENVIYDLSGRRVETITAPGIYVVNGRKMLVK